MPEQGVDVANCDCHLCLTIYLEFTLKLQTSHMLEMKSHKLACVQAGEMEMILQSITAGGLAAPDAPVVSTTLQSPSSQCNQLLRIADLQSVAIREESFVPEEAASPMHASSSMFLVAKLGYSPGEIQQPTAQGPPAPMQGQDADEDAQKKAMLRPPGLRIQVPCPAPVRASVQSIWLNVAGFCCTATILTSCPVTYVWHWCQQ